MLKKTILTLPLAAFGLAQIASASTIVYQDTFDDADGIGTNLGIGGGLISGTNITAADPFDDATGNAVAQTNFGNRVTWAHSANQFDLSSGFTLDLTFTTAATGNPSFTSSFGIVDEVTAGPAGTNGVGATGNLNAFMTSDQDGLNAVGFSTTTRNSLQGLNADFGTLASVSTSLNSAIVLGTTQSFSLTVNTDGSATFDLDGTSGSLGAGALSSLFTDSADGEYYFAAYSQGNSGFTLNDVTLTSLATIPEPSAALLGAFGMLGLLRRRR
ncbi:MAG: PEP-CTERM sorting domain-containing protein [Verrucomicrobiota bacterium JB025]|nr:PEP-CTERM sorting domain-containing protein [Verrucomicrobiota bacterium JB025]